MTKVIDYPSFSKAVSEWNAARYEQEFDMALTMELLSEELLEAGEALGAWYDDRTNAQAAHLIKEVIDCMYIAEGAAWKANIEIGEASRQQVSAELQMLEAMDFCGLHFMATAFAQWTLDADLEILVNRIAAFGMHTLQQIGVPTIEQAYEMLNAVCVSNASKPVQKTASNVKANAGDKGPMFIKAEPIIEAILNRGNAHVN